MQAAERNRWLRELPRFFCLPYGRRPVSLIDVRAIGPNGSTVGFAALNGRIHDLTGVHMTLYILTDWLGLVPVAFMLGFCASRSCPMDKPKKPF